MNIEDFNWLFDMAEYGIVANRSYALLGFLVRPPKHQADPKVPDFAVGTLREEMRDNIRKFLHKKLDDYLYKEKLHYYETYLNHFSIGEATTPRIMDVGSGQVLIMLHLIFKNVCVPKYLWDKLYYETKSGKIIPAAHHDIVLKKPFRIFEYVSWFILSDELVSDFWRHYTLLDPK